jgi:hypothetical protein
LLKNLTKRGIKAAVYSVALATDFPGKIWIKINYLPGFFTYFESLAQYSVIRAKTFPHLKSLCMKNKLFLFIATVFVAAAVNAQSTADSIRSKYQLQAMPEALTLEKTFPVIGTYQLSNANGATSNVTISIDQDNRGIIYVDGLPEGRFKAYLKKSPGTYRVVAQKSESGRQIPEGTLNFDPSTNTLNVALGKKFDDADPTSIFSLNGDVDADVASATETKVKTKKGGVKTKTKVQFYTATKADAQSTSSVNMP